MHLVTGPSPESEAGLSRYLLPCQVEGVLNDARYQYTEKANRVGWTWTMALKDVRKRIMCPKRDCLFTTQNWNGAVEFGRYIDQWLDLYNWGRFVISRGEEWITVQKTNDDGSKVAVQEKVGLYKFDGGSRIILFSSSPWAIQTFEGDVRWDEAAFHDHQEQMHAALSTRIQFGYDYHVWSAHNGMGSWFNQVLGKIAKKPGSGWHCRKITIYDVIDEGLVEKINERAGTNMSRAEFLEDCRRRALTPAIFSERFECNPADSGSSIVPWGIVEKCRDQEIERAHLGQQQVAELFGHPHTGEALRRPVMERWLDEQFGSLKFRREKFRVGFDVAASGKGDLASIWTDARTAAGLEHRALLTTQTEDWDFLRCALLWFMRLPDARGCGDSTGLGRDITWTAEQRTHGRFVGIPFNRGSKSEMGARLMNQLTSGERRLPSGHDDVAMDIFSLQKRVIGNVLVFEATQNPLNAASHCDMAWSAALSGHADASNSSGEFGYAKLSGRSDPESGGFGGAIRRAKQALGL